MMGILDRPKLGFHKPEQFDWKKATAVDMYVHIYGSEPEWATVEEPKPWLDKSPFNWKLDNIETIPGLITDPSDWVWVEKDGKMAVEYRPKKILDGWEIEENDRRRVLLESAIKQVLYKDKRRHTSEGWPTKRAKANRRKKFPRRRPTTSFIDLRKGFEIFDRKDYRTGQIFETVKKTFRISALPNMFCDGRDIKEKIKNKWPVKAVWRDALDQAWSQLRVMSKIVCEGNKEVIETLTRKYSPDKPLNASEASEILAQEYGQRQLDWLEAVQLFQGDLAKAKKLMARQARLRIKAIRPDVQGEVGVLDFLEWELVSVGEERATGQDILWAQSEQAEKLQGFSVSTGCKKPRWMTEKNWNDIQNRPALEKEEEMGSITLLQYLNTDFTGYCGKRNPDLYRKFSGLDLSKKSKKLLLRESKEAKARGEIVNEIFLPHKVGRSNRRYQAAKRSISKKFKKQNER